MRTNSIFAAAILVSLVGCATSPSLTKKNETDTKDARERLETIIQEQKAQKPSNFTEQTGPLIAIKPLAKEKQEAKEKEWLTNIRITLDPAKKASIPATAIVRMFRDKGINIVTSLPLDLYTYNGFGVTNVNAETALMVFLGAMGLDYDIDNSRQLVTIEPMKPKTWVFNIGNRRTSFNSGTDETVASSTTSSDASTLSTSSSLTTSATTTATTSTPSSSSTTNANAISSSDDVWSKLSTELTQRLTILVPKPGAATATGTSPIVPALTQNAPGQFPTQSSGSTTSEFYNTQTVGRFSINPETGAITVQAPKYILKPLNEYLTKVQEMYNTTITFEGELVTITTNNSKSESIDWSLFEKVSGGVSTVIQNNVLGGAVITPATATNAVVDALTIGNPSLAGANALFGLASSSKKFAAFNAFLSSVGQLKIKDTPLVTTTSGTPVNFQNYIVRHYQRYEQTSTTGTTGSAAVATNTIDVPYKTGMTLRIMPRYDVFTGLVRAPFSIQRAMKLGSETKINAISAGNTVTQLTTETPILSETSHDGELLLKNGDLVVVGGLKEDAEENNDSGVTGTLDSPLKALTGKGTRSKTSTTYYLALRVTVSKKD